LFYGEGVKGKRVSVPHIPDIQAQIIVQDSEIYSAEGEMNDCPAKYKG
jgi:hypothetical protein